MKLFFACPKTQESFATEKYTLQQDHRIRAGKDGEKELQGTVILDSGCPFCGQRHAYAVKDIGCPLETSKHE